MDSGFSMIPSFINTKFKSPFFCRIMIQPYRRIREFTQMCIRDRLRVTLKLSDGTQLIASRYGIDASVAEGQTVRCSFLPTDAVLVDREDIHEEA